MPRSGLALLASVLFFQHAPAQTPDALIKQLQAPEPRVRQLAAEALGKQRAESAVPSLARSLKDADKGVHEAVAKALEQIGTKAIGGLVGFLSDADDNIRLGSINVMWRLPANAKEFRSKETLAALASGLKDKNVDVRIHAAMILGNIGKDAKPALAALIEASKDTDNLGTGLAVTPGSVTEAAIQAALKIDAGCIDTLAKTALPSLIAAVKSDDAAIVQAAGFALAKLGTHAKPALEAIQAAQKRKLEKPSFSDTALGAALKAAGGEASLIDLIMDHRAPLNTRIKAISDLSAEASERSVATLIKALGDPDPQIRTAAVDHLDQFGPKAKDAIPKLIELLADDKIRDYAVTLTLTAIGPDAISAMIEVLKDAKAQTIIRFRVTETLGRIGPKAKSASSALEANLKDKNAAVALKSADAFVAVGGDVAKALTVARAGLKKDSPFLLYLSAQAIGRMGERARAALPDLMPLLKNDEPEVRIAGALALGRMGSFAKPVVPAIAGMLSSKDGRERYQAAKALADLGANAKDALPALIEALKNLPGISPHPVLTTIGNLGADARPAVPALVILLKKDGLGASQVVEVLGQIGPSAKAAVPELAKRLANKSDYARRATARTLAQIGPEAKEAVPALKLRLMDESKVVRIWAACALARITSDGTHIKFLIGMWEDQPEVRRFETSEVDYELAQAFDVLGPDARPARDLLLVSMMDDKKTDLGTRMHAAGALGQMAADADLIVPKLIELLGRKDASDYRVAAEGLRGMGAKAKAALPRLRELLDHEGYGVADGARKAIAKIDAK